MEKPSKQILCVDDQTDFCELVAIALDQVKVISAGTKSKAIALARTNPFDLYLLDYHLPDGNGVDLCRSLRTFDSKTPILFITATSSMTESQAILEGAQGLVHKARGEFLWEIRRRVFHLLGSDETGNWRPLPTV